MNSENSDRLVHSPGGGLPRLLEIMRRLRDPETGCPWDVEQTYASIAPYTIEEAYEVADAIERGDMSELRDELGDLLLQVVYYAQMADEESRFDFHDIAEGIAEKMLNRHPHVFGDEGNGKSSEQQTRDWERIKAAERLEKNVKGTLAGVAIGLPALTRAVKLQKRAARVGFDWPTTDQVLDKITEECREVVEAREALGPDELEEEIGDLLFVMANFARHLRVDPEKALRRANAKFTGRFEAIEKKLAHYGRKPAQSSLEEMDALWNIIKAEEKAAQR
ncbi:nucleoside triphosphate pyrophosphohydrolase [Algicella marina]|uniref:Nucleoside triphosphate pyrophosphohydrolase n=1 Tax=Algicella marina TaxID=2683284 RepID=A0A6P1T121_9RHOB|nr:nucleoside triphosphate pyrophosphohydrolase [Algicella marina]QHQ34989.1 nucleoside triphosphate pyrophosphohydrolase [Algicella marina]